MVMKWIRGRGVKWVRSKEKYKEYEWKEEGKDNVVVLKAYGNPKMLKEIIFEYKGASGTHIFERYTLHEVRKNVYVIRWVAYKNGKEAGEDKVLAFTVPWFFRTKELDINIKKVGVWDTYVSMAIYFAHLSLQMAWLL